MINDIIISLVLNVAVGNKISETIIYENYKKISKIIRIQLPVGWIFKKVELSIMLAITQVSTGAVLVIFKWHNFWP